MSNIGEVSSQNKLIPISLIKSNRFYMNRNVNKLIK